MSLTSPSLGQFEDIVSCFAAFVNCIVYVVMFCASRDHESWQGVASLGLLRLCFAKLLALLVGQPDAFGAGESRDGAKKGECSYQRSGDYLSVAERQTPCLTYVAIDALS